MSRASGTMDRKGSWLITGRCRPRRALQVLCTPKAAPLAEDLLMIEYFIFARRWDGFPPDFPYGQFNQLPDDEIRPALMGHFEQSQEQCPESFRFGCQTGCVRLALD